MLALVCREQKRVVAMHNLAGAPLDRAAQPPSILIRLSYSKCRYNSAGSATITMAARE